MVAALACACTTKPPKGLPSDHGGPRYDALETMPSTSADASRNARATHHIKTVFIIVLENHDWASIKGNSSAPFLNALLSEGAHAEAYRGPEDVHPSGPNYIWLEAGDNLGIFDDDPPQSNHRTTPAHLTRQLDTAEIAWTSYQEDTTGDACPLTAQGHYAPKHNPMIYFDDVTDGIDPHSAHCIAHVRPYAELARDLATGTVAAYNFISPNLCHDMHDTCISGNEVTEGDAWLAREVPAILSSKAYLEGGALFIVWDENDGVAGAPIGLVTLSPFAKHAYANTVRYTHSSLLRTVQDIFALQPYLRDAENVTSLGDLFSQFP